MLMRMFVTNGVARLGGWLDWVAKTLRYESFQPIWGPKLPYLPG